MLRTETEQPDEDEKRQDMIEQIVEAIQTIEIKSPAVTVHVPKPEVTVNFQAPKAETPVVNVSPQAAKIEMPKPSPHPLSAGVVCKVTKRGLNGFIEEFTIRPIKP
jgi:hypothetical protein